MKFNSLEFLFFFSSVTLLYFLIPHRFRWVLLLVASCLFYMAFIPIYILILFVTILIDFFAGILIENSDGQKRLSYLVISIISTCAVLFVFKYFDFFNTNFASISAFLGLHYPARMISIILPIGLSFHTFQSLSYVIEVYRGNQKAERHFGIYSLYVMFYPQLVAGPIERPQNLLHQFREPHSFEYRRVTDGLKLMTWGLFKKVVIADRLAIFVNQVYSDPHHFQGPFLILATIFFAFQIYCDFSGYSDIAIGSAQVMGFRLMDNFNRPYFAKTISEFWKRWHISLSTWFKDYVYIPLGGNKVQKWRWQFNLMITFALSGLWHGASWTYVVWGALNGFYLIFAIWTHKIRTKWTSYIGLSRYPEVLKYTQVFITFCLICFAWIFFRANTLSDAWYIITHLFSGFGSLSKASYQGKGFLLSFFVISFMEFVHLVQRHSGIRHMLSEKSWWIRWLIYFLIVLGIIYLGKFGQEQPFIYFQF